MLICVCLRILASSIIPRYDLGRQNPLFLRWFCHTNHVKNLSKDITSSKKQDIAFKASKKGKSKKVVEESSSEEEDNDDDDESIKYDPNVMALFIRRFSKMMSK
jgi:hypothetical protein